jgi:hypothetical protein
MATPTVCSRTNSSNYREPEVDDMQLEIQPLLDGTIQIDEFSLIKDLDKMKAKSNHAFVISDLLTPPGKDLTERLQRNTNGWIDTAKDCLTAAVHLKNLGRV